MLLLCNGPTKKEIFSSYLIGHLYHDTCKYRQDCDVRPTKIFQSGIYLFSLLHVIFFKTTLLPAVTLKSLGFWCLLAPKSCPFVIFLSPFSNLFSRSIQNNSFWVGRICRLRRDRCHLYIVVLSSTIVKFVIKMLSLKHGHRITVQI